VTLAGISWAYHLRLEQATTPIHPNRSWRPSHRLSPGQVDAKLTDRGPLLLISGSDDHTVPLKVTKEVFGKYAKASRIPSGRCSMVVDAH